MEEICTSPERLYCYNKILEVKTNIRDEGNKILKSNASLTKFSKYINTNQIEYIYVTHKSFYDRRASYRKNIIVQTTKIALEYFPLIQSTNTVVGKERNSKFNEWQDKKQKLR